MLKFLDKNLKILLPEKLFILIKRKFRFIRNKFHTKINEKEFTDILINNLGIKKGSVVFIHSSMNKLFINFPITKIVTILQNVVGREGTLLFACYQSDLRAEDYLKSNPTFDVRKTPTAMGLLPEYVRRLKSSYRSLHPTHSIVAIGKLADELTNEHHKSIYPHGEKSPFYKLVTQKAKIIGLGVRVEDSLTFVHTVEDIMKDDFPIVTKNDSISTCTVIDKNNEKLEVKTLTPHIRIGHRNMKKYFSKYVPKSICRNIKVKNIDFFRVDAEKMFNLMHQNAQNDITIYTKKARY